MNKIGIKRLLVVSVLATVLGASVSTAFAQKSQVRRVGRAVSDGDRITYVVRCTDGSTGTMYIVHDRSEYCAIAQGGKLRCKKNWSLTDASQHACKAAAK